MNPAAPLILADNAHLMYLAGFHVDPFSLGGGFGGALVVHPNGDTLLFHDDRLPDSVLLAHASKVNVVDWYDGIRPPDGLRALAIFSALEKAGLGSTIHDRPESASGKKIHQVLSDLRRAKDADEIALVKKCVAAAEAGHAWALENIRAGLTEMEVYAGVQNECALQAGRAVVVYGDFAESPGPERKGGPPTDRFLLDGDMFILDFSVVLGGYRCDFTNTIVVGGRANKDQARLLEVALKAMAAGEGELRPGAACSMVYAAVKGEMEKAGMGGHFPHHAGHGIGLAHPEAPFIVPHSQETLVPGDIITLEPGLYVSGVGGLRIERNYLITQVGFECLTSHEITLT